jgi:hypothetical protein
MSVIGNGVVRSGPRGWLKAEGLAVFALSSFVYFALGAPWWLYAALILAPDLAMLGYLGGPVLGARVYNLAHTYIGPIALVIVGAITASAAVGVALIWFAHIGLDRMLGYGLKYPTAFGDTHLGSVGKKQAS